MKTQIRTPVESIYVALKNATNSAIVSVKQIPTIKTGSAIAKLGHILFEMSNEISLPLSDWPNSKRKSFKLFSNRI